MKNDDVFTLVAKLQINILMFLRCLSGREEQRCLEKTQGKKIQISNFNLLYFLTNDIKQAK